VHRFGDLLNHVTPELIEELDAPDDLPAA